MNFEDTKRRIYEVTQVLRKKETDYGQKAKELEEQRNQLKSELEELQSELKKVDDQQAKAESELVQTETEGAINDLTKQIANCRLQSEAVQKAVNGKIAETDKLERQYAENFVDGQYSQQLQELKKKRDADYQKMTDCIKKLSELHKNLLGVEVQWQSLLSERNSHATKIGVDSLSSSGWNISVETVNGSIGYALPSDFGAFLSRLGEIIGSGVKLIA